MTYVPIRQSRLGRHYRQHMQEWYKEHPFPWRENPVPKLPFDTCRRCKVSYFFQRMRWWMNGDIIV